MCDAKWFLMSKWKISDIRSGFWQATIMYTSIVSRETFRISLMIAALNDLEVRLGDILNACVQAPIKEKVLTTLGPEFDKDTRKTAVIIRVFNGLKSTGASLVATLPDAWNSWVINLASLTQNCGLNQK